MRGKDITILGLIIFIIALIYSYSQEIEKRVVAEEYSFYLEEVLMDFHQERVITVNENKIEIVNGEGTWYLFINDEFYYQGNYEDILQVVFTKIDKK